MKNQAKSFIITSVLLAAAFLIIYSVSQSHLERGFIAIEDQTVRQNVHRIQDALADELHKLDLLNYDWAVWDETCKFIEDRNEDYIKANLYDESLVRVSVDLIAYLNPAGTIIYEKAYDFRNKKPQPFPDEFKKYLAPHSALLHHPDVTHYIRTIILLNNMPLLVSSRPIIPSSQKGPIRGTLIMARYLSDAAVKELSDKTGLPFTLQGIDNEQQIPEAYASLLQDQAIVVKALSSATIAGYALINDLQGKPAVIVRMESPRNIYQQGQRTIASFTVYLLLIGLAIWVIAQVLLCKLFSSRDKYIATRLSAQEHLKQSKDDLRTIIDNMQAGFLLVDPETHTIMDSNAYTSTMFGAPTDKIINNVCHKFVCPAELGKCPITDLQQEVNPSERVLINAGGERIPILKSVKRVTLQGHEYLLESFIDITAQKATEENLQKTKGQLEKFVETSIDPIIMGDSTGHVIKPNKAFLDLIGHTAEEIMGLQMDGLSVTKVGSYASTAGDMVTITEDFFWESSAKVAELFEKGSISNWEAYYLHKSGTVIPVMQNIMLIYDNEGGVTSSFSIIRDLTAQKKKEKALRPNKERARSINESSKDAIITPDAQHNVLSCNGSTDRA